MKPKCGTRREDGKVFWRLHKTKGEIWISEEQYERRTAKEKEYRIRAYAEWKKMEQQKPPELRNYLGKYCPRRDRFYLGVSSSGKQMWVTRERLADYRRKSKRAKRKHIEKCLAVPKTALKIGDPNPENPNEFVVYFTGNKPYFGDRNHLKRVLDSRAMTYRKRHIKSRKIRAERLSRLEERRSRGEVDPETGLIFWEYNRIANEVWLQPEIYHARREKCLAKRKDLRRRTGRR
jgi:hypothetical protein